MRKKFLLMQKNWGITPYMWSIASVLPFYFIFQSSSTIEIVVGIVLTIFFFISYGFLLFQKNGPFIYGQVY